MFETLKNAWKIETLRKKILYTLFILIVFRIGVGWFMPYLDPAALREMSTSVFDVVNSISGSALGQATVFSLGIQPYINSSIIVQLLAVAIPALERLSKEGEEGRKKMNTITKWVTLGLAVFQSIALYVFMNSTGLTVERTGFNGVIIMIALIMIMVAGSSLCVWLGNQISENGIGNGVSMLIFAGVISRFPDILKDLITSFIAGLYGETKNLFLSPIMLLIYVAMIFAIVYVTNAERRIPVQYAKRVVGRKMMGGQASYIPIKVIMGGVMPVIFASTFLSIPELILGFSTNINKQGNWYKFLMWFDTNTVQYGILYFILVFAFTFFYSSIQFNAMEMANNIKSNSGTIPGIRPGRPTAEFINKIVSRINFIGGLFLAIVAAFPVFFGLITGMNFALAGTSIIIVVGVCLETVKQIESEMMMRHYKGFLQ